MDLQLVGALYFAKRLCLAIANHLGGRRRPQEKPPCRWAILGGPKDNGYTGKQLIRTTVLADLRDAKLVSDCVED